MLLQLTGCQQSISTSENSEKKEASEEGRVSGKGVVSTADTWRGGRFLQLQSSEHSKRIGVSSLSAWDMSASDRVRSAGK